MIARFLCWLLGHPHWEGGGIREPPYCPRCLRDTPPWEPYHRRESR